MLQLYNDKVHASFINVQHHLSLLQRTEIMSCGSGGFVAVGFRRGYHVSSQPAQDHELQIIAAPVSRSTTEAEPLWLGLTSCLVYNIENESSEK